MKLVMALAALALVAMPVLAHETVDLSAVGAGVYYLNDDGTVWEESNGLADLQTSETIIRNEDGSVKEVIPADEQIA